MSNEKSQKLMEKIALLLQAEEKGSDDSDFIRASFEKINQRLDKVESQLEVQSPTLNVRSSQVLHPSQEKLKLIEDLVDEIIVNQQIQKACMFETHKPCDNCSMCNSRGF